MLKLDLKFPRFFKFLDKRIKEATHIALENAVSYYTKETIKEADKHTKTGHLKRSIKAKSISWNSYKIFANAEYAPFVEFGTRSHIIKAKLKNKPYKIRAKRKPYLVFKYKGRWIRKKEVIIPKRGALKFIPKGQSEYILRRLVHHPGTKPSPFFFPQNFPKRVEKTKSIFMETFLENLTRD